jgi:hypothetical protein
MPYDKPTMRFNLGEKVTLKVKSGTELTCRVVGQKNGMLLICRDLEKPRGRDNEAIDEPGRNLERRVGSLNAAP